MKIAVEELPLETSFPANITIDGENVTVQENHVKRLQRTDTVTGEWYIPHVIEPAFGIDRIIWHILDHCLLYTSPSPRDRQKSRMPSSA